MSSLNTIRFRGTNYEIADAAARQDIQSLESSAVKVETVSGTSPSIYAEENTIYLCGEIYSLTLVPPQSGMIDVRFTSGSSATVLNVTGGVLWPDSFDPYSLSPNTVYEINIMDGIYGAVMSWAS